MAQVLLKGYLRVARWGFGLSCCTTLINAKAADWRLYNNSTFFSVMFMKGVINGLLWPTIPVQLYVNSTGFTRLGYGIERPLTDAIISLRDFKVNSIPKWKIPD